MSWIFWICFIVSLLVSYWDQRKTLRLKDWALIIGVFLLCEFYINLFGLLIPVGFFIALIYMYKKKQFLFSKALIFGLISVCVIFYGPKISLNEIHELTKANKYTEQFNQIKSVSQFSVESDMNGVLKAAASQLKEKNPKSEIPVEDPHVAFSIWVLQHRNVAIKDLDWLWYEAPLELHYYWQSNRPDQRVTLEYVIFNEVGYMGVFERKNEKKPYHLRTIYEFDRLKAWSPMIP
ncbi:hypothetical protein CA600_03210 [Paenibacillus sp. VTT E-133280]|uniref:hypothetical protein n=1 Tax=Paenibacillus sp. VTT E-133280 TaxID=1986222 RepID=UPI000BA00D97|nr:hypothetical protein [Paenibacillus sp. VTT E-133280]OZQ69579.1 hypothetical protein CA600_03210 [Paenibacillus sp. VTT E-133280]